MQISTMGDPDGNAQGGFLILDQDLKVLYAGPIIDYCAIHSSINLALSCFMLSCAG